MEFAFFVDSKTAIFDNLNKPISFADLKVGELAEIDATRKADGKLVARRIKVGNVPRDEITLTGAIESLGSSSFVFFGVEIVVEASTAILDNQKKPIQLANLQIGHRVEVRANRRANGTLLATRIKLQELPNREEFGYWRHQAVQQQLYRRARAFASTT